MKMFSIYFSSKSAKTFRKQYRKTRADQGKVNPYTTVELFDLNCKIEECRKEKI